MKSNTDTILLKTMSCNIKKIRKKWLDAGRKSFTQRGCADKLGVKQQQWNAWEAGKRLPSAINQRRIAELLEVSLAELRSEATPAGLPLNGVRSAEMTRLIIQCLKLQESLAGFVCVLLGGGFGDASRIEAELQETLRCIQGNL